MTTHRFTIGALLTFMIAAACLSGGLLLSVATFQHELRQFGPKLDSPSISVSLNLLQTDRAAISSDRVETFDRLVQQRESLTTETPFAIGATLMTAPPIQITTSAAVIIGGFVSLVFLLPRYLAPRYFQPIGRRRPPFDAMLKPDVHPVTVAEIIVVTILGAVSSLALFILLNSGLALASRSGLSLRSITALHPAWIGGIALLAGTFSQDAALYAQRLTQPLVKPPGRS